VNKAEEFLHERRCRTPYDILRRPVLLYHALVDDDDAIGQVQRFFLIG
jgi:hypothetical protein